MVRSMLSFHTVWKGDSILSNLDDLRRIDDYIATVVARFVNEIRNCDVISGEGRGVELVSRDLVGRSRLEIVDRQVEGDDELRDERLGLLEMDQEEERYGLADY